MILAAILAAAAIAPAQTGSVSTTDTEERLISWSLSDLAEHLPGSPRRFREVNLASLRHPEGITRPLLCGEVQVAGRDGTAEWVAFATLETSGGYEQWLGGSAGTWCNPGTSRDPSVDLSTRFERQLVREE